MPAPSTLILYSGVLVGLQLILFSLERKRNKRFLASFREWLDSLVLAVEQRLARVFRFFERDIIRQMVHYIFHVLLSYCLLIIKSLEALLQKVLHFNRIQARQSNRTSTQRSIFDEIKDHKAAHALTPAQKRKQKDNALNGK